MLISHNGCIQLDSEVSHKIPVINSSGMLITGLPGSGKSMAGTLAVLKIMRDFGGLLLICDSKRSDLFSLNKFLDRGNYRAAASPGQIARLLRVSTENMLARYEHFNQHWGWSWFDYHLRPVIIFFDEVCATLSEAGKDRNEILSYLKQIIYRSRQMGFFVIMASQRLSATTMDRDLSLELSTRIVLGANSDPNTLQMAFPGVDVKQLPVVRKLPGHGLIYTDLLGSSVPQTIVVDDISRLNIPMLIKRLDRRAAHMNFAKESYWEW